MTPFDFDFRPHRPAPPLARLVETIWYARGTVPYAREKIAPTGSTVAIVVLGDPLVQVAANGAGPSLRADTGLIIGPHVGPVINEPTGETFAVGIVTTPVGCAVLFGAPPASLRGQVRPLFDVWALGAALRERLLRLTEPDAMIAEVEATLSAHLQPTPAGLERCAAAVGMLEADPRRPIAEIAAACGISHAHLDREFVRIVGLTPRALSRLLRLRRMLVELDVRAPIDWAGLAADWGWFDQAHLIRDFKRHTGVTPTQYVAAQRATYAAVSPEDAAGFVPEG